MPKFGVQNGRHFCSGAALGAAISEAGPNSQIPSAGIIWRRATANASVGSPLAEWAYVTPRFPKGISKLELRGADQSTQRETALIWFLANYKVYSLIGGHYFAFDRPGHGFGQAPLAPSPAKAEPLLQTEFGAYLAPEVLEDIGRALAGDWMLREDRTLLSDPAALDVEQRNLALDYHADRLISLVERLAPPPGHNGPLEDVPLTEEDRAKFLASAQKAKQIPAVRDGDPRSQAREVLAIATPIMLKLGKWLLSRADDFGTEYVKSAARALGDKTPHFIAATPLAAAVWHEWHYIDAILQHLAK